MTHALVALIGLAMQSPESLYRAGVEAFEKGRLEEARGSLEQALRAERSARNAKALGVVYAAARDYAAAEPLFRDACARDSREPDACYFWARTLYALDRFEASLAALEKAAPVARPARIHLGRAQALEALSREAEAENEYRRAVERMGKTQAKGDEEDATLHYGVFLIRQGRAAEAIASLHAAMERRPDSPRVSYELGRALAHDGRLEEARRTLNGAVRLKADYWAAHLLLGNVNYRLGRTAEGDKHTRLADQGSRTYK